MVWSGRCLSRALGATAAPLPKSYDNGRTIFIEM